MRNENTRSSNILWLCTEEQVFTCTRLFEVCQCAIYKHMAHSTLCQLLFPCLSVISLKINSFIPLYNSSIFSPARADHGVRSFKIGWQQSVYVQGKAVRTCSSKGGSVSYKLIELCHVWLLSVISTWSRHVQTVVGICVIMAGMWSS